MDTVKPGTAVARTEAERLRALAREARLEGPDAPYWVERLEPERNELLRAVRYYTGHGDTEAAVELAADVWRLWHILGHIAGGRQFLAAALDGAAGEPSSARALALYGDGLLAFRQGAQDESRRRNEAALAVARSVRDSHAEALALVGLSRVALRDGDYGGVRALAAEARERARRLPAAAGVAPLHMLAAGTRLAGDLDAAAELYRESLALNRHLGDRRMVGVELHNLGHLEVHRGNLDVARGYFTECVDLRDGHNPYDVAMTTLNEAAVALAEGDRRGAAELLGRTQSALERAGIVLDPDDAYEVDWLRGQLA